jgi:hypothetical protein
MPTKANNYYQDLLKKVNERKSGSIVKHPFGVMSGAGNVPINRSPLSFASNSKYEEIIGRFQKYLPSHNEPNSPNNKLSGEDKKKMTKGKKKNKDEEE